jgi:hypothetical protein
MANFYVLHSTEFKLWSQINRDSKNGLNLFKVCISVRADIMITCLWPLKAYYATSFIRHEGIQRSGNIAALLLKISFTPWPFSCGEEPPVLSRGLVGPWG